MGNLRHEPRLLFARRTKRILLCLVAATSLVLLTNCGFSQRRIERLTDIDRCPAETPVRASVTGILTYVDPATRVAFVQDGATGARMEIIGDLSHLEQGQAVRVSGAAIRRDSERQIHDAAVIAGALSVLPEAVKIGISDFGKSSFESRLVSLTARVEGARIDKSKLELQLAAGDAEVKARVRMYRGAQFRELIGSEVRVTGVMTTGLDFSGQPVLRELWLQSFGQISVVQPGVTPQSLALETVAGIGGKNPPRGSPVRLLGTIEQGPDGIRLKDNSGSIPIRVATDSMPLPGRVAEVHGFVTKGPTGLYVRNANVQNLAAIGVGRPDLTRLSDVRRTPSDVAASGLPVHIRGIVTYHDPSTYVLFVQDDTAGIYVSCHGGPGRQPRPVTWWTWWETPVPESLLR